MAETKCPENFKGNWNVKASNRLVGLAEVLLASQTMSDSSHLTWLWCSTTHTGQQGSVQVALCQQSGQPLRVPHTTSLLIVCEPSSYHPTSERPTPLAAAPPPPVQPARADKTTGRQNDHHQFEGLHCLLSRQFSFVIH
jgi:hypothetical protein